MNNRKPIYIVIIVGFAVIVLTAVFLLLGEQRRLVQESHEAQSRAGIAELTAVAAINQLATAEGLVQSSMGTVEAERSYAADVEAEAANIAALATADAAAYATQEAFLAAQDQETLAYQLALESNVLFNEQPKQFERSVLLALEAAKRFPAVGTVQALKDVLNLLPRHEKRISFDHSISDFVYNPSRGYVAIEDSDNNAVQIIDIHHEHVISGFIYDGVIGDFKFSRTGKYIVGEDLLNKEIIIWDAVSGLEIFQHEYDAHIIDFVIGPNDKYLGIGTFDSVSVWEISSVQKLTGWPSESGIFAFSEDGESVYVLNEGVYRWDIATDKYEKLFNGDIGNYYQKVFSPHNNYYFQTNYRTDFGLIHSVWSLKDGEVITLTQPSLSDVHNKIVFSPDERYLVGRSTEGFLSGASYGYDSIQVWDVVSGQIILSVEDFAYDIAFSPDSRYLAVSFMDNVRVWDTQNWQEVKRVGNNQRITEIAYSLDGNQLIAVDSGWDNDIGQIDVWDMSVSRTWLQIRHTMQPRDISAIVFTPDSKTLVTGGWNWRVHFWDTEDGSEISHLNHGDYVRTISISPDGQYLLSGGARNPPRSEPYSDFIFWDLKSGNQVISKTINGFIFQTSFSPDG